jgi:GNAT superfamily N-acetyltransferase
MVDVRPIRMKDWRSLKMIRLEALRDAPEAFCTRYEEAVCRPDSLWKDRASQNGDADALTVLALDSDRPVGMAVGLVHSEGAERFVEVLAVFVSADFRSQGVAGRILEKVEAWGRTKGATSLSLLVEEKNPTARRFYERQGYIHVNEWVSSASGDGLWQLRYRKKLANNVTQRSP